MTDQKPQEETGIPFVQGLTGRCGPNDYGYMVTAIREAAKKLVWASNLYSQGHYPHSNARRMPGNHPIALALFWLSEFDEKYAWYANVEHDPELFKSYEPPEEDMHRWDGCEGPPGIPGPTALSEQEGGVKS